MKKGKNYIGGKFYTDSQKFFTKHDPSTEELIGHWPNTDKATVNSAVDASRKAQKEWRKLSRINRADYIDRLIGAIGDMRWLITEAICKETGKNFNEANAEINEAIHMLQYTFAQAREPIGNFVTSEIAEKDITVFRKPKGVVAVITPWNFPFAISFWNCAPALLEGNTVVFKPSEDSPWVGELIAELYHMANFPENVFQLVHGEGETGANLASSDVDHICFTGSVHVGQLIRMHCADTLHKSCSCEMGSKSAVVVFDDAPHELAINACINSAFKLAGQRCVSSGRLIVHKKIYNDFCECFVNETKKLKVGNPFNTKLTQFDKNAHDCDIYDQSIFYGPLVNKSQFERVQNYNQMTLNRTNVLLEGKRIGDKGFFLSPHVYACDWKYANVPDENSHPAFPPHLTHPFLTQEVFGPHVAIIPFDDADDAVRIYNDTIYGLSLAVLTNNMSTARFMRENCDYGMGYHNLPGVGAESHTNFCGVKASGSGGGSAAGTFRTVTHEVTWTTNFDPTGFKFCQGMK